MASFKFNNVYIKDWYSIASTNETLGPIKKYNQVISDHYFGEKTFERINIDELIFIAHGFPYLIESNLSNIKA